MNLRVAGFQMSVGTDIPGSAARICGALRMAAETGADILLTPEGSLSGYTPLFDQAVLAEELEKVTGMARDLRIGLALGTCFREADGQVYDQLRFYDPRGAYLGAHAKMLLCGTLEEHPTGEINDYAAGRLGTYEFNGLQVGGLICNDLWANPQCTPMPDPHLSQQLARLGARIIFHAVNGGRDGGEWDRTVAWHFHEANLRMRAAVGKVWIVTVDSSAPLGLPCSAPSGVVDSLGSWACRVPDQGEQLFVHTLELD